MAFTNYAFYMRLFNGFTLLFQIFVAGVAMGMPYAVFPKYAVTRGFSQTTIGFLFGGFSTMRLIVFIIAGNAIPVLGFKRSLIIGFFMEHLGVISFGLSVFIPKSQEAIYITCCYISRIAIEALGFSFANVAASIYLSEMFKDHRDFVVSLQINLYLVGCCIGPFVGSGLITITDSFYTPFVAVGILGLIVTFINAVTIESVNRDKKTRAKFTIFHLLLDPVVLCFFLVSMQVLVCHGFYNTTYSLHLSGFEGMNLLKVSALFILSPMISGVVGFIISLMLQRFKRLNPAVVAIASLLVLFLSYLFLGPFLFPNSPFRFQYSTFGAVLCGLGIGIGLSSSVSALMRLCLGKLGLADTIENQAIINSMLVASNSVGVFLGNSLGGVTVDYMSFDVATCLFAFLSLSFAIPATVIIVYYWCRKLNLYEPSPNDRSSLLSNGI